MRDQRITTAMSHSEGRVSPRAMASWGVMVASMGAPPGPSQATRSTVIRSRSRGS
jgi:hypothetical protein